MEIIAVFWLNVHVVWLQLSIHREFLVSLVLTQNSNYLLHLQFKNVNFPPILTVLLASGRKVGASVCLSAVTKIKLQNRN